MALTAENTTRPGFWTGALVGLMLTIPLLALFYLGNQLVGLPLVPLDFFDFLVPLIPGGLITFVIDIMVDSIIAVGLGENVDTVAKSIEQAMGYAFVIGVGAVAGGVFFAVARRLDHYFYIAGAVLGVIVGAIFTVASMQSVFLGVSPGVAGVWVIGLFIAWGVAHGWLLRDLIALPVASGQKSNATPAELDAEIEPRVEQMGRREFLIRVGGATATLTIIGAGLGAFLGNDSATPDATTTALNNGDGSTPSTEADAVEPGQLPNANAEVEPAPGMRPEYTPVEEHYRIDIATRPIEIDLATWTLPFTGLIAQPREFTMDMLRDRPAKEQYVTMQCISNRLGGNLISTTKWTGVPVRDILNELELEDGAAWMKIDGADTFFEYVSIEMCMNDERIMFTYDFDDEPLPTRNGFPLRIYIPDRYGMKQPKWITGIEIVAEDERGYWVRRGWSADAFMQTTSVVDTIANNDLYLDDEGNIRVPVGGFAVAGERGISKVEVSVDGGDWVEADLRDPISDLTWVFWRYDWLFEEGRHTFEVRAYDREGNLQTLESQDVRPDGATGIHSASALIADNLRDTTS